MQENIVQGQTSSGMTSYNRMSPAFETHEGMTHFTPYTLWCRYNTVNFLENTHETP